MYRNILLLSLCQAFMLSATSLTMTTSALVGLDLAPTKNLATLPISLSYLALLITLIPSSLLMQKIGRRYGFMVGGIAAVVSGVLAGFAIYHSLFWLFCVAAVFIGVSMSSAQFYRFAAVEVSTVNYHSRAISWVLAGGLAAAFIGPGIARWTQNLFLGAAFSASFSSIALLGLGVLLCLYFIRIPKVAQQVVDNTTQRPLRAVVKTPKFIVAVGGAAVAYSAMNLLMISTPLAMQGHHHEFGQTTSVIQWHIVGMFAPSFFTGNLILRFGMLKIMLVGVLLLFACIVVGLSGTAYGYYLAALILLGIGWNFLYVGGTTLLTEVYFPAEKSLVQGVNDFVVFFGVAFSSISSGYLHNMFGWQGLNLIIIIPLSLVAIGIVWLIRQRG